MKKLTLLPFVCLLSTSVFTFAGEPDSVTENKKETPVFQLSQSDLKLSFGGRIQMDGAFYSGGDFQPMANGVGFRRVRLNTNATFGKNLSGKVEIDMAGGAFSLKDCYIKYDFLNGLNFRLGNFQEGFSMLTMTSSGDFLFIEHPNVVSAFSPEYHIGVQGAYQKNQFLGQAGIHFQKINGSTEKDNVDANLKNGQDEGISYTARTVWMPFSESKDKGFHLGIAASYRTPKNDVGSGKANTVRYSTASLSGIDKMKFMDTKDITFVNHDWLLGGELAAYSHALRFQSEYILNQTHRMGNLPTEKFNGYYAEAACMLFGGQQKYAASKGAVIVYTKSLAMELGKFGINVNCVSPGIVQRDAINYSKLERIKRTNFMNDYGKPEDIANMVTFVASDEASFITGQNIIVDGGRSLGLKGD